MKRYYHNMSCKAVNRPQTDTRAYGPRAVYDRCSMYRVATCTYGNCTFKFAALTLLLLSLFKAKCSKKANFDIPKLAEL